MKQPLTLRLDPELLAAARQCARAENRTLTNFVETVLMGYMRVTHAPQKTDPKRASPAIRPRALAIAERLGSGVARDNE